MNHLRMSQGRIEKKHKTAPDGEIESLVWNICSYQVPAMMIMLKKQELSQNNIFI